MPAGSAYPSGHLVPSPILGLANAPIVETKFRELAMSLLDFSPRIPLGTFTILHSNIIVYQNYIGTSIKVRCATRSLYAGSVPKAEGVPTNNQRGRGSEPCSL